MSASADRRAMVLRLADEGVRVEAMCAVTGIQRSQVYRILARHRPDRERQGRRRTSDLPRRVQGMFKEGIAPGRIAALLRVSRAYVYRIIGPVRKRD